MEDKKVWIITDGNGKYEDVLTGGEEVRQVALTTLDFINKRNDSEYRKFRLIELKLEGEIHIGQVNLLTTIKLNNIPVRAIVNNADIVDIIESYMNNKDNEYRKYDFHCEFIKIN